jgi:predicted 2-oxoglutarate/Fe(II)-dependent dioxygenase YbiX
VTQLDLLRYGKGGYFFDHVDSEERVEGGAWRKIMPTDVSVLIYLSDPATFAGGGLRFSEQGLTVAPGEGMAVAFPSDHRFPHCAERVHEGERLAVTAWLTCAEGAPIGSLHDVAWSARAVAARRS